MGTELSETDLWRDAPGHDGPLIRVDIDPAEFIGTPASMNIRCDAGTFLRKLSEMAQGHVPDTGWTAREVTAARARWRAESDAERPGIVPVCDALRAVMPKDACIFSDMTQFAYVAKEVWDMESPGLWHHPCGFGTLGYALPAAIGGQGGPARPDGGGHRRGLRLSVHRAGTGNRRRTRAAAADPAVGQRAC